MLHSFDMLAAASACACAQRLLTGSSWCSNPDFCTHPLSPSPLRPAFTPTPTLFIAAHRACACAHSLLKSSSWCSNPDLCTHPLSPSSLLTPCFHLTPPHLHLRRSCQCLRLRQLPLLLGYVRRCLPMRNDRVLQPHATEMDGHLSRVCVCVCVCARNDCVLQPHATEMNGHLSRVCACVCVCVCAQRPRAAATCYGNEWPPVSCVCACVCACVCVCKYV